MTAREWGGAPLRPGLSVDPVDLDAGLRELIECGWDPKGDSWTFMLVTYALQRWARGEEDAAEKTALKTSENEHGIDYTSWRRVLAAAVVSGTRKLEEEQAVQEEQEQEPHKFVVEFRDDDNDELVEADYYEVRGQGDGAYVAFTKPPFGPDQSAPRRFVAAYPLAVVRCWYDDKTAVITST